MILKNKGAVSRTIITLFGPIEFSRTQLVPADEKSLNRLKELTGEKSIYPLDCYLGIDKLPFKITVKMMVAIAKEAVRAASYERASECIKQHYGVDIGDDTVRKVTDFVGNIVFTNDKDRAEAAAIHSNDQIDRRKIHKRNSDILYIEMDGAMVNTRIQIDGTSWRECKIAIAFLSEDLKSWKTRKGEIRRQILEKRLIGYIGSCHDFQNYVLALAERFEYKYRNQIVVISDGADWIQKIVESIFPQAIHILDLSHVKEHVGDYGHYLFEDESNCHIWIDKVIDLIENSETEQVLKMLEPYKSKKHPKNVLNLYTYIDNHKQCMDYKRYKEHGYFVGSGASESANKYTMQDRMKLQGMRWKTTNAQTMLSLKCRIESGCWLEVEPLVRTKCSESGYLQG